MKTHSPTIGLVAALAFACANSFAQNSTLAPHPITPAPPAVPPGVTVPAQDEVEALAATETAVAAQNEALGRVNEELRTLAPRAARAGNSTRSLVIPKDSADVKNLTEIEEDMSVMARILEKAVNDKGRKSEYEAMGIGVFGMSSSGSPRNLYIDGFGALFFLNVNFPLLPPATKEQASESKSESNSDWEITRDELYHPKGAGSDFSFNFTPFDSGSYVYTTGGPAEEYDEDKVMQLKENLTAALKNASHIRRLKGDDTVTIVVAGRNPGSPTRVTARRSQNGSSSSSSSSSWSTSRSGSQPPAARLLLHAKRSDIESFQKDKLSVDDFRKKVTMFIY